MNFYVFYQLIESFWYRDGMVSIARLLGWIQRSKPVSLGGSQLWMFSVVRLVRRKKSNEFVVL